MNISKSQAQAIAEGFLDSLGSGKEGLEPLNSFSELIIIAGELIEDAQGNLNRSNSIASGKLSASLVAEEPTLNGKTLEIRILMNEYGQYVNKGVRGLKAGQGVYQFKYPNASLKMIEALKAYLQRATRSTATVKKYKGHGKNERKNKKLSTISSAYALGRSIKQTGIKPTGFLDKAIAKSSAKMGDRLLVALVNDVSDAIDQEMKGSR